eukprot:m.42860 g.42860  ORF g.42860 m.42860 type:complete len:173 (-) comp9922_c0_seq1:100-618(-)
MDANNKEKALRESNKYCKMFSEVTSISPEVILSDPEKYLLIDVRDDSERKVSTIPHSISAKQFQSEEERILVSGKIIVPFCTIGYRSGVFAKKLISKHTGDIQVRNMAGIIPWIHAGGPLVHRDDDGNERPVQDIHTYGAAWNMCPSDYNPTYYSFPLLNFVGGKILKLFSS